LLRRVFDSGKINPSGLSSHVFPGSLPDIPAPGLLYERQKECTAKPAFDHESLISFSNPEKLK
jgi:hypothetical protein